MKDSGNAKTRHILNKTKKKPFSCLKKKDGLPPKWKEAFLKALSTIPNVTYALEATGIAKQTAYSEKNKNAEFRKKWEEAILDGIDNLEKIAMKRAAGVEEKASDSLIIFMLKNWKSSRYRDRVEIFRKTDNLEKMSDEELVDMAKDISK